MRKLAVALVYPNLCLFEFSMTAEVFGLPRPEAGPDWYDFETVSTTGRSVAGPFGGRVSPTSPLSRLADADVVIVPGWTSIDTPISASLKRSLVDAHDRGARLVSICSGSFALAHTGLLDGRRATTHWRYAKAFAERFPQVSVDPDVLYVESGRMATSAGSAAGLDLLLHVVRSDFGVDKSNMVARRLVIAPHRQGGQAQFVELPVAKKKGDPLASLMDWMTKNISTALEIDDLASRAGMSKRTFLRSFRRATGTTPYSWIVDRRLRLAQALLTETRLDIDRIADQSGLGTAVNLRHHFKKRLKTSPTLYRSNFLGG